MKFSLKEPILLADDADINKVQLMRTGNFRYYDDTLEVTSEMLIEMKKNFDNGVRGVDLAVDYFHYANNEAAGWISDVILENNDTELWIAVEWTEAARKKIMEKEIRYLSADFNMNYTDNESGEKYGAVLNGAGLTNRPFIKGMNPILHDLDDLDLSKEKRQAISRILNEDDSEKEKPMKFNELKDKAKAANLTDEQKAEMAEALGIQLSEPKEKPAAPASDEDQKLSESDKEIAALKAENAKIKKEREFDIMLSEGKVVEAQRESFLENDMTKFVTLSQPLNMKAKGDGKAAAEDAEDGIEAKTKDEAEDKIIELAEKLAKDEDISLSEAQGIVLRKNPNLAKLVG